MEYIEVGNFDYPRTISVMQTNFLMHVLLCMWNAFVPVRTNHIVMSQEAKNGGSFNDHLRLNPVLAPASPGSFKHLKYLDLSHNLLNEQDYSNSTSFMALNTARKLKCNYR